MEKNKKSDRIFQDILDDDFVNSLRVSFSAQRILGMLGVNLKYKFITPPTGLYKAYSAVVWSVSLLCIMYTVMYCNSMFDPLSTDIPLKIGMLISGTINAGLSLKSSFFSGHVKSQLYVKLQRIERTLKMKNAKYLNKKFYMSSLMWAVISVVFYGAWLVMFNKYFMSDFCPPASVATSASSTSFVIIFHIYIVLSFISLRVQYINDLLEQVRKSKKEIAFTTSNTGVATVKIEKEIVHGLCCILDSFADTMDVFEHAIFFFTFQMLAWQLITMQNLVITFKKQMPVNIPSFLCTLPISIIFMCFMLTLCFTSQALTNRMEACEELCNAIISSHDEGESRENAKRLAVLLKARRPATVFDIFTVNTQLPFHLFAITASYTIVLLQFATL